MLKFCSLYSGSSGNSLFVQSNNTKILVDCGTSAKKIETALDSINIDISDIDAILVTHEHSDHVQGIGTVSKKYDIPVFANFETWDAMKTQKEKIANNNENYKYVLSGSYEGTVYETVAALRVGWEPEVSCFDKDFDMTFLKRCRAYDNNGKEFDIEMVFKNLENNRYISDGNIDTIVIKESDKAKLGDTKLEVITY